MAESAADEQEGPAVLGEAEIVCWTPCCRQTVRVDRSVLRHHPLTVACPRRGEVWRVRFRRDRDGVELVAVWTYALLDRF